MNDLEFLPGLAERHPLVKVNSRGLRLSLREKLRLRYSANLVVDVGGTCQTYPSLPSQSGGVTLSASGAIIGNPVDMLHSDTFCNVGLNGILTLGSGSLRVQVQTSDAVASGTFTDPTSGLAQLPTSFLSGGIIVLNSGDSVGGLTGPAVSGQYIQSGFSFFAGFQRPQRYARLNVISGLFGGPLIGIFLSQYKTTGSGGGFTLSPGSGTVSV